MNIDKLKDLVKYNVLELAGDFEQLTVVTDQESDSVKVSLKPSVPMDVDYQEHVRQLTKKIAGISDDINSYTIRISMEVLNMNEEYQNPDNFFVKDLLTHHNKTLILNDKYTYIFNIRLIEK